MGRKKNMSAEVADLGKIKQSEISWYFICSCHYNNQSVNYKLLTDATSQAVDKGVYSQ